MFAPTRSVPENHAAQQVDQNVIICAALVFDGKLLQPDLFWRTTLIAVCFSLLSSSVYILNVWSILRMTGSIARKSLRPLPSGQLNPRFALVAAVILATVSLEV